MRVEGRDYCDVCRGSVVGEPETVAPQGKIICRGCRERLAAPLYRDPSQVAKEQGFGWKRPRMACILLFVALVFGGVAGQSGGADALALPGVFALATAGIALGWLITAVRQKASAGQIATLVVATSWAGLLAMWTLALSAL